MQKIYAKVLVLMSPVYCSVCWKTISEVKKNAQNFVYIAEKIWMLMKIKIGKIKSRKMS